MRRSVPAARRPASGTRPSPPPRPSAALLRYSQLVDPTIRRAGGLEQVFEDAVVVGDEAEAPLSPLSQVFEDAVVVVDEGHNLPAVARAVQDVGFTGPLEVELSAHSSTAPSTAHAALIALRKAFGAD